MDASHITNTEADAFSHDQGDVIKTEQSDTEIAYQASGEVDFIPSTTRSTDESESETYFFKSPTPTFVQVVSSTSSSTTPSSSTAIATLTSKRKDKNFHSQSHSVLEKLKPESLGNSFELENKNIRVDESESENQTYIPYKPPEWSGKCEEEYSFDVLKNGSIIGTVSLSSKPFFVFGRLPSCDITLEHPSLSRYHAAVQYNTISTPLLEKGWYIYDLDSTHGTWVNKKKISPKIYYRLRVGHIVKFGGSTRLHILQGPAADTEDESEMTVTEMKQQHERLRKEAELLRQMEMQEEIQRRDAEQKLLEDRGCGWGIDEDAEDNQEENPYASLVPENENLYIDDPKKALKGFYEREGCDLPDYQFTEVAMGKHKCRLELPVDGPNGEELVAEVVVTGKRKDAVVACALEACRILDKCGLLRSASHESRKRKQKKWEDDDFYDSDEDTFLDRTGTIEKKRSIRMKNAGKSEPETYESLLGKYNTVAKQIQEIETRLHKAKEEAKARESEEMDELDAYMMSIKAGAMDAKTHIQLKGDLLRLRTEEQKLRKLVNIAKPASLPPLKPNVNPVTTGLVPTADSLSRKLHAQQKQQKKPSTVKMQTPVPIKPDDYEEQEEDEEEMEETKNIQEKSIKPHLSHKIQKEPMSQPFSAETVKGPSLPSAQTEGDYHKKKPSSKFSTSAFLNILDKKQPGQHKERSIQDPNFDSSEPDYAMWLPPSEQSGDGRTSLNDKLGY